jgi:uncharacterized integral membrane protein (TIGR00698 family)
VTLTSAMPKALFIVGLLFALSPWASPPLALAAGLLFGLTVAAHPFAKQSRAGSKWLLQASVVALGFGMNLPAIVRAGRSGFLYTAGGIAFTLILGTILGKLLKVRSTPAFLIATGTAICGGSAIAAVGPITGASDDEMSVSLGTVFILNSVALLTFPYIGTALHLTQNQFGLWAALAIHDTSSVVGAAAKYGAAALAIATTVKLARALWIIPVSLGTAAVKHSHAKVKIPWFIFLFILAAVANSYVTALHPVFDFLFKAGKVGLTVTLFLIGASISRKQLKTVGVRPLVMGVVLWLIVASVTLGLIRFGWIAI